MIVVIGGAYQGKEAYVRKEFPGLHRVLQGEEFVNQEQSNAEVILNYHLGIKALMEKKEDPFLKTRALCEANPKVIITLDELGCGIVPIEEFDRRYRECVGRIGCLLAEKAEQVIRVYCGIPERIK
ncbi:MAG: bifunctional adenosylcobinamide kinase/adenosylcobinamide-phosphate guanylyltransferase [Lachnospiraceae bacterium]